MSSSIPASAYVEHFDSELAHHRAWLQAVLERLVAHDPKALEEGGTLRRLWTEHQQPAGSATQSQQPRPHQPLSEASSAGPRSTKAPHGNPLSVPWFSQLDSSTDQARRMCFSSSCAMLLAFLRPGVLSGANGDDQYLQRVRRYGDTTNDRCAGLRLRPPLDGGGRRQWLGGDRQGVISPQWPGPRWCRPQAGDTEI
jgi:hypothetical protein